MSLQKTKDVNIIACQMIWAATWKKTQQNECAPSEYSDQPRYPPSLISLRYALNG